MPGRGPEYLAVGVESAKVADIIEQCASRHDFRVAATPVSDSLTRVTAIQRQPWYRVLVQALPQVLTWEIRRTPTASQTSFRVDRWYSSWYLASLTVFAGLAGWLWVSALRSLFCSLGNPESLNGMAAVRFGIAVVALLLLTRAVTADGRASVTLLLEDIRDEARACGGVVDEVRGRRLDRRSILLLFLLSYVGVVSVVSIATADVELLELVRARSTGQDCLIMAALAAIVLLLAGVRGLVLGARAYGADHRLAPMLPAMLNTVALVALLTGQLSFHLLGKSDGEIWDVTFEARGMLDQPGDMLTAPGGEVVTRQRVEHGMAMARSLLILLLTIPAVLWLIAGVMFAKSVMGANHLLRVGQRLRRDIQTGASRATASAEGFMRSFRRTFAALWALTALLIAAGIFSLLYIGVEAIRGPVEAEGPSDPVGIMQATANAVCLLLSLGADSKYLLLVVRFAWAGLAILAVLLFALSVGSLLLRRYHAARRFRKLALLTFENPEHVGIRDVVSRLAARADQQPQRLVVTPGVVPYAAAHEFGALRRERFLELSAGTVDVLGPTELEALLAHEMSHHVNGHCWRHNLLQLLGRVTLFGGAFAGALEDSFGYELAADRTAVTRFGIRPDALRQCLLEVRAATALNRPYQADMKDGLGFRSLPGSMDQSPRAPATTISRMFGRLAGALRCWLLFYTSATLISYWHPSFKERIDRLGKPHENVGLD